MPSTEVRGQYQLRLLSARLREAGTEGKGLRRELYRAISDAAKPVAAEVGSAGHLRAYLPDPYADVLASDLTVGTQKRFGRNPSVAIRARGRAKKRKIRQLDAGTLNHPLFGNRKYWFREQVRPGFFTDPVRKAAPEIRAKVLDAMAETGRKLTGK